MPADYYEILGVERTATDQEIKSAYRRLALKFHPDRNPGNKEAEEKFKEAAEAYGILADSDKRQRYDAYGHAGVSGAGGAGFDPTIFADFGDILGDFFGFGDLFGRRARGGPRRGSDLRYNLELTFEEAAFGTETQIQIPRTQSCGSCKGSGSSPGTQPSTCPNCRGAGQVTYQQGFFSVARTCGRCRGAGKIVTSPCPTCEGQGVVPIERKLKVPIPPGVDTGSQLRITGEGEPGAAGGPPGDLYVVIGVQDHEFFHREGSDLHCEMPISFAQASLGGSVEVPTPGPEDEPAKLSIPEGTQTGTSFKLKNKGVPHLGHKGRGDLHVTVRVVVPTRLSSEQKRLIEQLAKTLPEDPAAQDKGRSVKSRLKDLLG